MIRLSMVFLIRVIILFTMVVDGEFMNVVLSKDKLCVIERGYLIGNL